MRKSKIKDVVYIGFMDLEKAYERISREALWQLLRMYDVGGKLLNGIKSTGMYLNSLSCVRVKRSESECFRIDSVVRQEWIIFPWLVNVYMDAVRKEVQMGMRRR